MLLEFALVRWAMEVLRGHGFEPVDPAGARARGGALRHRLPARTPSSRSTAWPTTSCTSPGRARSRWPRCTPARSSRPAACRSATRASRLLPARGRRRGPRHARHLPRAPVRQGRDVRFVEPEDLARRARAAAGASRRRSCRRSSIPYRVVNIAVDDLGASAAKKYDCEAWLPGQGRYRELTSTSNTTDFQARRLDIRYRPRAGAGPASLHTLNGTAVAVGRTMIALLENGAARRRLGGHARGAARVGRAVRVAGGRARMSGPGFAGPYEIGFADLGGYTYG